MERRRLFRRPREREDPSPLTRVVRQGNSFTALLRTHGVWVLAPRAQLRTRRGRRDIGPHSRDSILSESFNFVRASSNRGRREDRVRAAPAVSCALMHRKMRTRAYRFSGNTPAFPAQWLYGLYRALPGESEPLATIAPGRRWPLKDLTPAIRASGPHDLAVRNIAARPHASSARRRRCVHRIPSRAKRRSRYAPLV